MLKGGRAMLLIVGWFRARILPALDVLDRQLSLLVPHGFRNGLLRARRWNVRRAHGKSGGSHP